MKKTCLSDCLSEELSYEDNHVSVCVCLMSHLQLRSYGDGALK